jgi:ribose 1,5-bisphosphate isomerase
MNVAKVAESIQSMKVQGAKEIALYSLKFLRKFCKKYGFGLRFEVAAMILERARPTAVVLHNCLEILKKRKSIKTIDYLIKRLETSTKKVAKVGGKLVKEKYKIMTHCHSGEALAVLKEAWRKGKKIQVFATITEPLEQGVKTAKELSKLGIPLTLITDNAVSYFMKEVDCVIVGTDAIRLVEPKGIVNKIGTKNIALAAAREKKPFIVVGNTLKIDRRKKFVIEERPAEEVYAELMTKIDRKRIKVRNPAFDLVEFDLVSYIVNEKGIYTPQEFLKKFR